MSLNKYLFLLQLWSYVYFPLQDKTYEPELYKLFYMQTSLILLLHSTDLLLWYCIKRDVRND
jgi:hypothetical protein